MSQVLYVIPHITCTTDYSLNISVVLKLKKYVLKKKFWWSSVLHDVYIEKVVWINQTGALDQQSVSDNFVWWKYYVLQNNIKIP